MKLTLSAPPSNLGDEIEEPVRGLAVELGISRDEMLKRIVREWLEKNAYLPVREPAEDNDVAETL